METFGQVPARERSPKQYGWQMRSYWKWESCFAVGLCTWAMLPRLPFDSFLMLSLPFSVDVLDTPSIFKDKAQVQNVAFDFLHMESLKFQQIPSTATCTVHRQNLVCLVYLVQPTLLKFSSTEKCLFSWPRTGNLDELQWPTAKPQSCWPQKGVKDLWK